MRVHFWVAALAAFLVAGCGISLPEFGSNVGSEDGAATAATGPADSVLPPDFTPPDLPSSPFPVSSTSSGAVTTSILSGPLVATNSTSAEFAFACHAPSCTIECRVGNGVWYACESPELLSDLQDGIQLFSARGVVNDTEVDLFPPSVSWTVDTVAPYTDLLSGPSGLTSATSATFEFVCDEGACTYSCRLDGEPWGSCTSPWVREALGVGLRRFDVLSRDLASNVEATPTTRNWQIE